MNIAENDFGMLQSTLPSSLIFQADIRSPYSFLRYQFSKGYKPKSDVVDEP